MSNQQSTVWMLNYDYWSDICFCQSCPKFYLLGRQISGDVLPKFITHFYEFDHQQRRNAKFCDDWPSGLQLPRYGGEKNRLETFKHQQQHRIAAAAIIIQYCSYRHTASLLQSTAMEHDEPASSLLYKDLGAANITCYIRAGITASSFKHAKRRVYQHQQCTFRPIYSIAQDTLTTTNIPVV